MRLLPYDVSRCQGRGCSAREKCGRYLTGLHEKNNGHEERTIFTDFDLPGRREPCPYIIAVDPDPEAP